MTRAVRASPSAGARPVAERESGAITALAQQASVEMTCHDSAHLDACRASLATGDLFGTGTLSGLRPDQAGSLLELTEGGKRPISLSNGERRTFLEGGDAVILRGQCRSDSFRRIGFGECRATVLPAIAAGAST